MKATIVVDMKAKCKRCGKGGATQNGYCLKCILRLIKAGELDYILKREGQK